MIWYVVATLAMIYMPFMISPEEAILVHNFVGELIQRRSLAQESFHSVTYPPSDVSFPDFETRDISTPMRKTCEYFDLDIFSDSDQDAAISFPSVPPFPFADSYQWLDPQHGSTLAGAPDVHAPWRPTL